MSFLNPRSPPPPPATATPIPGATIIVNQPQYSSISTPTDVLNDDSSTGSSPSPSTSIIIVIIVIASAIIVSATIYLLLRLLSRRCRRSFRTYASEDDVVVPDVRAPYAAGAENNRSLLETLPLFTFSSLNRNFTGGDCAVCLSKFEPPDQLRLLPLCCHAFHADCIGTWLTSNLTCPLCRSTVNPSDRDILNKIRASQHTRDSGDVSINVGDENNNNNVSRSGSFRVEMGSLSRRRDSVDDRSRRSYSVGIFDYLVDDACEVPADSVRGASGDKDSGNIPVTGPPGENLAADVAGNRSWWLRDYVDRLSSYSFSSRTLSFRSSGRFFAGSSRRSEAVVPVDDLEASRQGEEISEFFRWLSPV